MKSLYLFCCGVFCVVQARAQTNNTRSLSLEEAIQLAVEHNFDVQYQRFYQVEDQYNLAASYGAYDPAISLSGRENFGASGGGFNSTIGTQVPPNQTYDEAYAAGIGGYAPWGLNYNINSTLDKVTGTTTDNNGLSVNRPEQYSTFSGITLDQPLLKNFWIDNARASILVAKKNLKIDELNFRNQLITTVSQVEQAYYELIFSFENVRVQQAAMDLANQLVSENKRKVEVGAMAPLDEKQAESQAAASESDLIAALGGLQAQQNTLKALITDQYGSTWHDVSISPAQRLLALPEKFDLQESWKRGVTTRPDLLAAKTDLERRGVTLKYRYNQLFPALDLVGAYGRSGLGTTITPALGDMRDERLPSYTFGATLTIPLSNRAARNNYKEGKSEIEQAKVRTQALEQSILIAIDNAIKSANTDYKRVESGKRAREYAELALQAEQKKLEVGKSTSFQVLQLQRDLTSARSLEIRALADYNKDLAVIAQSEGTTLERFKLNVKVY